MSSELIVDKKEFNWLSVIENIPVCSLCIIENKTPVEIISNSELKAKAIKMMSEMVRVGHFLNIDFPENFINHNLKRASMIDTAIDTTINECIKNLEFIIQIAEDKKMRINQTKEIFAVLKDKNG